MIAIGQLALGVVAVGQSAPMADRRRAAGVAGLTALTALWWFAAGQPLVAALA